MTDSPESPEAVEPYALFARYAEAEWMMRVARMNHNLNHPYLPAVTTLYRLVRMGGVASLEDLRFASCFTPTAFSRVVRQLLEQGMVEKFADEKDGRRRMLRATDRAAWCLSGHERILAGLPESEGRHCIGSRFTTEANFHNDRSWKTGLYLDSRAPTAVDEPVE